MKKEINDLYHVVISLLRNNNYTIVIDSQNNGNLLTVNKATHEQASLNTCSTMLKSGTPKEIYSYLKGFRDCLTEFN